jgi:hypothetical protein
MSPRGSETKTVLVRASSNLPDLTQNGCETKIWSWVMEGLEPRMTDMVKASTNLPENRNEE